MAEFGKFELLTCLAKGGMAEVFLARQKSEGRFERLLVIKRILPQYLDDERFVELFLEEARIAALLDHPNVIPVYDFGRIGETYFIAMPHVEGLTVAAMLRETGAVPIDIACEIVRQTLTGLEYVHERTGLDGEPLGLVHRDVSPSNLMVNVQGRVLLLDFGVASAADSSVFDDTESLRGKLAYMSPEQAKAAALDARSDLFSLGVVFFELVTGTRLFKRRSDVEVIRAVTEERIPDPRDVDPDVPGPVAALINRALARDPDDRFPTAASMKTHLAAAVRRLGVETSDGGLRDYLAHHHGDLLSRKAREARLARRGELSGDAQTIVEVPRPKQTPPAPRGKRRLILALVIAAIALAAAAALPFALGDSRGEPAGPPLSVALTPYLPADVLLRNWQPVFDHVGRQVGRRFELTVEPNYEHVVDALLEGDDVDLAELTAYPFILAKRRDPSLRAIVTPVSQNLGTYESYFVVRREDPARSLADVRGKRVCYIDPTSTSGYLMPRAMVRKTGHDPDDFFSATQFSANHFRALRDLLGERCDVATVTSPAFASARQRGIDVGALRIIAISPPLPEGAFCASRRLPDALVESIREVMLAFDVRHVLGRDTLSELMPVTGFRRVDPSVYEDLEQEVAQATKTAPRGAAP